MKSPPEPKSTKARAGMRCFPTRRETDKMSRESDEDEPVKVMDETGTDSVGGGVGGSSVTRGSTGPFSE